MKTQVGRLLAAAAMLFLATLSVRAQAPARIIVANASSTGTSLNHFVKLTGAPSTAVVTATSDTSGIIGVCIANCGTSGNAVIQTEGLVSVAFDGATTAGHYVQNSGSTGGDGTDAGSTYPTNQVLGRVLSTHGSAGTYQIDLFPAEITVTSIATVTCGDLPTFTGGDVTSTGGTCTLTVADIGGSSASTVKTRDFGTTFGDTGGSALTSGSTVYFTVPYACTIAAWNISVDAGTATLDIWKIASGTAIPTISNSITASAQPAISSGTSIHSTTLTGWTTSVSANDIFGINLKTVATAKFVELDVQCNQ